jgi:hypothetical protein
VAPRGRRKAAPDAGERIQKAEAALSAALRARGHEVEAGAAVVSGERINFRFEEVLREMQAPLTAEERRSVGKGAPATKRVLMPTGKPVLIAKPADRHGGGERRWTDKGRRLEDQMDRIVLRFEAIAQKAMDGRIRAEEFDREFKASMRRAALRLQRERAEAARPKALRALAARWTETRRLRAFLDAAETHIASESAPGALAAWLDWARAYVEDFDPLSSASLEELRAETEHLLSLPKDDGDWDEDEQEWRDMGWLDDLSWLDERD